MRVQLNNYLPTALPMQSIPADSQSSGGGSPVKEDEIDRAAVIIAYAMANPCKSSLSENQLGKLT